MPIGEPVKLEEPAADADTSTVAFGQAEPGRDVFAGHPHDEIKSVEKDNRPKPDEEKAAKEISSVHGNTESATEVQKAAEEATDATSSESSSSTAESSTAESSLADSASSSAPTSAEATPAHNHAEGPKDQEEAEAERAREALFPDAQHD